MKFCTQDLKRGAWKLTLTTLIFERTIICTVSSRMDTKAKECSFVVFLFVAGGWCGESLWLWEAYRNCLQSVRVSLEKKNPLRTMCPLSHVVHLQPWSGSCSGAVPWVGGHCWEMYGGVFGHHNDIGEWRQAARKLILYTNKEMFAQIPVMPQLRSRNAGGELHILWTVSLP